MKNSIRLLQAAVAISAAVSGVLLFQIRGDFAYASPFYVRIVGIPVLIALTIAVFWISSWSSTKSIIYGSLILALILELIPMGLFLRNDYPSTYYVDPQGKIVLSTFPGNVFEGRSKGLVTNDVIAASDWQKGITKDPSGKPLRFYRIKSDGAILVFEYPVENGQILQPLDNATSERYESQQITRAESFVREGDLTKATEILNNILTDDPNSDIAYRMSQRIRQQEDQAKAEAEKLAAEKAEAERLEAETAEKDALQVAQAEPSTTGQNLNATRSANTVASLTVRNHPQRYRTRGDYNSDYYSDPTSNNYRQSNSCCQQPSVSYAQPPVQTYRRQPAPQSAPRVESPSTPSVDYQRDRVKSQLPIANSETRLVSVTQSQAQAEPKKGMSWKKKLLIGAAIAGGVAVTGVIITKKR